MMRGMRLSGAAWSWVGASLAESAAIYRALGVGALDLIAIPGKPLDTYQIAVDPQEQARRVQNLDMELSNLLMFFGTDFHDRALNAPDPQVRQQNFETFKRVLEFCAAASVHSVVVLPGVQQKGYSRHAALEWTSIELNRMNKLAKEAGVVLTYEPHVESILATPQDILQFAKNNSDLRLVIDYSHAISLGFPASDLEHLVPYAGHVHLRQATQGKIQARWEEGVIDVAALMRRLQQTGYQGYLTLEYEHDPFWDMDQCDVMTETIKMRDAVLPFVS